MVLKISQSMVKNEEELQAQFADFGVYIIEALRLNNLGVIDFLLWSNFTLTKMQKRDFINTYEEERFLSQVFHTLNLLRNSITSVAKYKDEYRVKTAFDSMYTLGKQATIAALKKSVEDQLNQTSLQPKWKYVFNQMKISKSFGNSIGKLKQQIRYSTAGMKEISEHDLSQYYSALQRFDKQKIKEIEDWTQIPEDEQTVEQDVKEFPIMENIDLEAFLDGDTDEIDFDTFTSITTIDLSTTVHRQPLRIGIIGASGGGKSVCADTLIEGFSKNHKIIHLNDINDELHKLKRPNRKVDALRKYGKVPKSLNVELFTIPPYMREATRVEKRRIDKVIKIFPEKLNIADWSALLDLNLKQELAFSNVLSKAMMPETRRDVFTLYNFIVNEDIHVGTKQTILAKMKNLIDKGLFGCEENGDIDFEEIMHSKKISVFATSQIFDTGLKRGVISYFMRQIAEQAKHGERAKDFCVIIEEFGSLVPKKGTISNTKFEEKLRELFTRLRSSGVSVIVISQNIYDLPDWARDNISDWFIFRLKGAAQLKTLKEGFGDMLWNFSPIIPELRTGYAMYMNDREMRVRCGKIILSCADHLEPSDRRRRFSLDD